MCTVKKKLERLSEGGEVESESGRGEQGEDHSDDGEDEVIGPPLPPGFKVREAM